MQLSVKEIIHCDFQEAPCLDSNADLFSAAIVPVILQQYTVLETICVFAWFLSADRICVLT